MKKRNCWNCKFNKLGGYTFFGRCTKRKFKDSQIPNFIVDKGCYLFKEKKKKKN